MLNLVYHNTQDEKIYQVLSRRMQDRYNIFRNLPDTIEDEWIESVEKLDEMMDEYILYKIAVSSVEGVAMFRVIMKVITVVLLGGILVSCNINYKETAIVNETITPTLVETSHTPTDLPTETPLPSPSITPTLTPVPPEVCQGENGKPFYMEFSPVDGIGKIAYSGDGLTLFDQQTSQINPIHSLSSLGLKGWDTKITWSPEGNRIVFLYSDQGRQPDPKFIVIIADLSVGKICALISEPGRYSNPTWSPDGDHIALTEGSSGTLMIVQIYNKTITVLENDAQEGTTTE